MLTNRMHSQLWIPNVDSTHTKTRTENRTNGTSTRHVVSHDKFLVGNLNTSTVSRGQVLDDGGGDGSGRIALIAIHFDDRTAVNGWLMEGFMLVRIVWMERVRHIGRYHKTARQRVFKQICLPHSRSG